MDNFKNPYGRITPERARHQLSIGSWLGETIYSGEDESITYGLKIIFNNEWSKMTDEQMDVLNSNFWM